MKLSLILVLLLNFSEIYCEDTEETLDITYLNNEYLSIFRTIPTLFEHLLNLLQEKPEILERNDATVFTEDAVNNEVSLTEEDNSGLKKEENNVKFKKDTESIYGGEIASIFYLTPEEVMEQVLLIEQRLEDYNKNKK